MRKTVLLFFALVLCGYADAQTFWYEQFEAPYDSYRSRFTFDSAHSNNRWQIGHPNKTVFDSASAYSMPNVIVTDTLNPFPPNDTSVFTMYHVLRPAGLMQLQFMYRLDIDTGMKAKVEVSGDRGLNWINVLTEDTTYLFYWGGPKPRLDTSTTTWKQFRIDLHMWTSNDSGGAYTFPHYCIADTLIFRFTLISNADTAVHKDGWMMDNFYIINGYMEGLVPRVDINASVNIYPVPTTGQLNVHNRVANGLPAIVSVTDLFGREVFSSVSVDATTTLDLNLPDGIYFFKYHNIDGVAVKTFTISRR